MIYLRTNPVVINCFERGNKNNFKKSPLLLFITLFTLFDSEDKPQMISNFSFSVPTTPDLVRSRDNLNRTNIVIILI